jgi:hypothetical protein
MRKIYNFLTSIYNFISTFLENLILKNNNELLNNEFLNNGFCKINTLKSVELNNNETSILNVNKYYRRIILSKLELKRLINLIFIENDIIKKITNTTGFNYSIDFFTAYETSSIETNDKNEGWYANKPHRDLPFSKNTIKLIIPLHKITLEDGPMKILNKQKSKNFSLDDNVNFESATCDISEAFLFNPNICYHYASSPDQGRKRKQMMFQLNPSKKWEINENIGSLQKVKEPKFPFFAYLFNSKIKLDLA